MTRSTSSATVTLPRRAVCVRSTPNCSPGARVGVEVSGVALSATPSMSASG